MKKNSITKRFVIMFVVNAVALYLATRFIDGVNIPLAIKVFLIATGTLTLINFFIRPIIKLVLTPVIILTLGFGSILVNIATLFVLDFILPTVTIEGFIALLLTSLLISAVGLVINFSSKIL